MRKLYTSKALDPTINNVTLQNKVQMDIRFFFCRRANENIDTFTKDTFAVESDPDTGLKYIVKVVDEATKNHQSDNEMVTTMMPQMIGHPNCPVKNFETYISKLEPNSKWLWQYPKEFYMKDDDIWYNGRKIEPNPMSKFMGQLSHSAGLSRVYTNHSIRVTATTFLARNNFTAKQIMSITGHKSVNSLAIYQKVSSNEKLHMGACMNYFVNTDQHQIVEDFARTPLRPIAPKEPQNLKRPANTVSLPSHPQGKIPKVMYNVPENPPELPQIESGDHEFKENVNVNSENLIVPLFEEPEDPFADYLNVEEILQSIEKQNTVMTQKDNSDQNSSNLMTTTTSVTQKTVQKSPQIPIFQNCHIGSIGNFHVHIHKN